MSVAIAARPPTELKVGDIVEWAEERRGCPRMVQRGVLLRIGPKWTHVKSFRYGKRRIPTFNQSGELSVRATGMSSTILLLVATGKLDVCDALRWVIHRHQDREVNRG